MRPLLILIFIFLCPFLHAADCEGYIIQLAGDTVKGTIDLPVSKGKTKEILFADMWTTIKFGKGTDKPKKMKAGEIKGFGFVFEGVSYHYELLDLQKNTKQKAPKFMSKMMNDFNFFLLRVDEGHLPIYREYWPSESERTSESGGRKTTIYNQEVNIEIWIKNAEGTYIEIAPTTLGGQKKLKNFLKDYLKLENEFLTTVDDKAKFSDAEEVLKKYNEWKKK